jgi:arylsulfatase A-like enzyme
LDGLENAGRSRDLIVVVTADHGEAFGEHGAYIHANSLYREEIHVPLLVWSPGRVPAGFRLETPVSNAAVPATLVDLLGGDPGDFEVASLAPLWRTGDDPDREAAFAEMEQWDWNLETSPSHYGAIRSVVDGDHHLIVHDSLGTELYMWREDPRGAVDLAPRDSSDRLLRSLERTLDRRLPPPPSDERSAR